MAATPKKLRSDSVIGSLPPDIRAEVDAMVVSNASGRAIRDYLAEQGIRLSLNSVHQYINRTQGQDDLATLAAIARTINSAPTEGMTEAMRCRVKQRAFEFALDSSTDPKALVQLVKLVNDSERVGLMRRQVELAEIRAAEAVLAKAMSPEVQEILHGAATHEEKIAMLRPILFGETKPYTPTFTEA
ncbi:DUF3486 family protein [Akkermansia glycaniphila]|uniref:Uncharacterized protein n=1 Tax=Akkermansia glycaniphila TaxID=1679444 RepID=A0A1C7PFH2_9BACT|nr:DUF3486 family protein [Akkermansia glycaniphila]OCA02310.1 hypothetical protein AC781_10790 [Akkermansia glycaniphila]OCA04204.1 hypothetical protein AC781_00480 [Akkermansia glycaniphila]SEH87520.1 protein of unknown function (duf3486) [Akkermansia glycaniphila]